MKTNKKITTTILAVVIAFSIVSFTNKKARILIVGDSISIGYTPFVKNHFANKAEVVHNPGNAQHTGKGLANIKEWIGDGNWDIVQINWGLWDMCYRHPDSKVQGKRDKIKGDITFELATYKAQLDSIVSIIKQSTDAKIVFVTTSYVPTKEAGRFTSDPLKYNAAAKEVMKKHGVVVNDIYKKSIAIHNKYGKGNDDVHYEEVGYKKLSELIIKFLEKEL
tara:strand:+ start:560 stop:1222 length:663 start_codon:yes stop_codon:yes gene_type:complete